MAANKHSINQLIAEIQVSSINDAVEAQSAYSSFIKNEVLPIIEKVAVRLDLPGQLARIDKLEVDFGNFDPKGKNEEALKSFENLLEDKLARVIQQVTLTTHHRLPSLNDKLTFNTGNNHSGSEKENIAGRTEEEELFIYLLQHGCLPWWSSLKQDYQLPRLAEKVLQEPGTGLKNALEQLCQLPAARSRMAFNLPLKSLEQIIQLYHTYPDEILALINAFLKKGFLTPTEAEQLTPYFLEKILRTRQKPPDLTEFLYQLLEQEVPNLVLPVALKAILQKADGPGLKKTGASTKTAKQKESNKTTTTRLNENKNHVPEKNSAEKSEDGHKPGFEIADSPLPATIEESGEKFFVNNAGLVIVFNYLPVFFELLGLTKNNHFVNPEAMQRAVYLLQYLAHGKEAVYEEHLMLLNKVACGLPLQQPLTLKFEITETEVEECQALLQAVATNWTAIGRTSGEGMRDAFLVRDGLLEQQTNGWNLKIEKNTIDLLVDRLPWSISILKLPWSESLIFVDWT